MGVVTSTWPRAHTALYRPVRSPPWLHLNAFRGEPAISTFGWNFSPLHKSSPCFATQVGASLDGLSGPLHSAHGELTWFRVASSPPRLLQTRLPCGSPPLAGVNLRRGCTRRIILQKARHQPLVAGSHSGLWLLVRTRFQGLFHPPCGVLFTFPSRYWFTIGRSKSLALESGLPSFPQGYTCLVVLRMPTGLAPSSSTGLSPALVRRSSRFEWQSQTCCWSYNPSPSCEGLVWALPGSLATTTGISC
jgi:hypothetical protein